MTDESGIFSDEDLAVWPRAKRQAANIFLRLLPLAAKLILTLYMGRYLSLSDMGTYGLVFSAVMILIVLFGQRFDYTVTREIVGERPDKAMQRMRDQAVLYGINCLVLALIIAVLIITKSTNIENRIFLHIFLLTALEGYASQVYENMNALNSQVMANVQFFLRSGLWVFPVVVLGVLEPSFRTVDAVLIGWISGVTASYLVAAWVWRAMPWRKTFSLPVDWRWLWSGLKKTGLIWLGGLGLAAGFHVDRFVVMRFLGLEEVGVITFYASFNNALLALIHSGVSVFAYPRMIVFNREGKKELFRKETLRAAKQVAVGGAIVAAVLGTIVPLLGRYTGHMEYELYAAVLWLMLAGTWLRSNADVFFLVLYARHQDCPIWLGNLLFLVPALGFNALFVPVFGLKGIGYGTICASLFLLGWRAWFVFKRAKNYAPVKN